MSERQVINEIKQLLSDGLNQKALMSSSDFVLGFLRDAANLSNRVENPLWSTIPKYRLAHLLLRDAKTVEQLCEIADLLSDVLTKDGPRKLEILSQILLIAVIFRLKQQGVENSYLNLAELIKKTANNVRFLGNNGFKNDAFTGNLQGELFNLLELATYFSGEEYSPLEGLCPTNNYIELIPLNASPHTLWRIIFPDGSLDAFAYTKEMAEEALKDQIEISKADFYYVFEHNEPTFYSADEVEIIFGKYKDAKNSAPAFLVHLHSRQGSRVPKDELLRITPRTDSLDKFNTVRQIRTSIRKAFSDPKIVDSDKTWGDKLGSDTSIVGMVSQKHIKEFFSNG